MFARISCQVWRALLLISRMRKEAGGIHKLYTHAEFELSCLFTRLFVQYVLRPGNCISHWGNRIGPFRNFRRTINCNPITTALNCYLAAVAGGAKSNNYMWK
jgi:hypothetical protein